MRRRRRRSSSPERSIPASSWAGSTNAKPTWRPEESPKESSTELPKERARWGAASRPCRQIP
eukprot:1299051-Prymnesium_polylepis.1